MRVTRLVLPGAIALMAVAGIAWGQAMQPMDTAPSFHGARIVTMLTGDQEIGSVATRTTGQAYFDVRSDGSLHYRVTLSSHGLSGVTGVFVQMGREGQIGPVLARLYVPPQATGYLTGTVAEGTLTAADLAGPLAGKGVDDLVRLMMDNNAYINITTAVHSDGEIRGDIPYSHSGGGADYQRNAG